MTHLAPGASNLGGSRHQVVANDRSATPGAVPCGFRRHIFREPPEARLHRTKWLKGQQAEWNAKDTQLTQMISAIERLKAESLPGPKKCLHV
jgi:hypothetical protein